MTNQPIDPIEFWRKKAVATAAEPASWLWAALLLKRAATTLWEWVYEPVSNDTQGELERTKRLTLLPAYMLLVGLSLENLIKGAVIEKEPERVRADGLKDWGKLGHDLPGLFKHADIQLSDTEADLLHRLKRFVEWSGRYPVPYRFDQFRATWLQDDPARPDQYRSATGPDDNAIFSEVFLRIAGRDGDEFWRPWPLTNDEEDPDHE